MLLLQGVGRRFGSRWVVRGLSFELKAGECLVLSGPNGSGKSTLIKLLARLLAPTEGRLSGPPAEETGLFVLDQSLYPQLTVREHLDLFATLRQVVPRPEAWADSVGLSPSLDRPAGELSTGTRARLKLLLATLHQPRLLLLDEPSASLDDSGRSVVGSLLRTHLTKGAAVLATNDPRDLEHATHRLAFDA
ncbi:MAG: ABC transporter ATP-binding protein [Fimbriimonadaceae bacterium]|nr:ABC transporter ATP-binding protein [Fimbriimonadaceae bacterium]QYK58251.1 MAG: ABC transporter ATP-binding protein [Fimbriimonadaceae bacterium]